MNDAPLSSIDGELETLPPRWAWGRPLEIGEASLGKMLDRAKHTRGSALPYLRNLNVRWGGFDLSDLLTMYFRNDELERYSVQQGDLLICEGGEPGRCAVWHRENVHVKYQKALHRLRLHEGIEPHFVMYHFMHYASQGNLERFFTGSTIKHFTGESLQSLRLKIAPANEQQRIVAKIDELFSELDAGVASLKRAQALLKKYRQAVLKAAVTGELTRDWRERHRGQIEESGADLLQRILKARRAAWEAAELKKLRAKGKPPKDDRWKQKYKEPPANTAPLPALPEGWVWATVQQLCDATRPISYGVLQPGADMSNGVPLVRVGDVANGQIALGALKRIRSDIAEEYRRTTLRGGEVLLTVVGSIGRTAVVPPSLAGANIARAVAMLPVSPLIPSSWVECWLRFEPNRQYLENSAHEVARKTLNLEDVRGFAVPVPPIVEQDRIIEEIEDHDSIIDVSGDVTSTIAKQTSSLRQSVLKAAFEGKLVPQDPNDEPASVLLERIRAERAARPKPARGRRRKAVPGARQLELLK